MACSTSMKNKLIGEYFGSVSDKPTTWYCGLSSTDINADGSGFSEPSSDSGYARVAIPVTTIYWTTPTSGYIQNKLPVTFNELTTNEDTITNIFLSSSETGNADFWQKLDTEDYKHLDKGTTILFNEGDYKISIEDAD